MKCRKCGIKIHPTKDMWVESVGRGAYVKAQCPVCHAEYEAPVLEFDTFDLIE